MLGDSMNLDVTTGVAQKRATRHLRRPRVLCDDTGKPLTRKMIQVVMRRAARRANVKPGVHILRHTFCSHLAMRGAPARAIQELAGHQDLGTTQRYMHLSPAALDAAIRLLEDSAEGRRPNRGEIVEASAEPPVFIEGIGGGAGSCNQSAEVSIVREIARFSGQTADESHFRRLH
jgi:hypothetical protein